MKSQTHIKLVSVGDQFCVALGELAANSIAESECAEDEVDEVMAYLQDRTSLFSPLTADTIRRTLSKMR